MNPHSRKLLIIEIDQDPTVSSSSSTPHPSHPPPLKTTHHPTSTSSSTTTAYYTATGAGYNMNGGAYRLNAPFDSSMALTVLVLLTAFFFMGFFSIYIRRFADDSSADPSSLFRRRRRRNEREEDDDDDPPQPPYGVGRSRGRGKGGVDPETVQSLPVYRYECYGGGGEGEEEEKKKKKKKKVVEECAICLSEFEGGESVKEIPSCGHVFHVDCIDMWLGSHSTCPLCRTEKIFPPLAAVEEVEEEEGCEAEEGSGGVVVVVEEEGAETTVDLRDTWREEVEIGGGDGRRRSCSLRWAAGGDQITEGRLRRSLSI